MPSTSSNASLRDDSFRNQSPPSARQPRSACRSRTWRGRRSRTAPAPARQHNCLVSASLWPLSGLRLRAAGIELRWPTADDLDALADLAAGEPYDPAVAPLAAAGPDASPAERARALLQYHWRHWGAWTPLDWTLDLAAEANGMIVGSQMLSGRDFAVRREAATGSWLGQRYRRKGTGTTMRAAILCLAFDGLGAESVTSGAATDNAASAGVSRKLGYADDGVDRVLMDGTVAVVRRFRLDRAAWQARHPLDVEIGGLTACLAGFGLS